MKNRIVSFLLTCILIVIPFMSGCSPKEEANVSDKSTSKAEREKVTNVFKTNWLSLPENYTVSATMFVVSNARIYMLGQPEDSTSSHRPVLISYNADGGDMQFEETPYDDITNFTILSDGSIVYLLSVYNSGTLTNEYWLNKIDTSGNEVFSVNVSDIIAKSSENRGYYGEGYITNIALDSEDRIYLLEAMSVTVVSPDTGEKLFFYSSDYNINSMIQVGGKVAIQYYDPDAALKYIDADERKIGDSVYIPKGFDIGRYEVYSVHGDNDSEVLYYYKTDTGLYSVSESDSESTEMINWMNSDISPNVFSAVTVISDDRIFYTDVDRPSFSNIISALVRIPDDEVIPKYVIEVAYVSQWSQYELVSLGGKFNQENENYRVRFIDYKQLSGNLEGDELTAFINREFALGNIPDVFLFSNAMTGKEYEDKGLFVDLYEYLDNDSELSRDNFLRPILPAGEVDGKLYKLISSFRVKTIVGKTENIGDVKGWSMSEYLDIAENLPNGVHMIQNENRERVYNTVIRLGLVEFIDYESGTCSFSSDLFIRLLDYIKSCPNISDVFYSGELINREYRENIALLNEANIYDLIEYIRPGIFFGTEELTFAGYPGGGEKIVVNSAYAISAKSEKEIRDGAWEFIRYAFLNLDPSRTGNEFPSTYKAFYRFAQNEMKGYYLVGAGYYTGGSSVEFTQEQIDRSGGSQVQITQEDVDEVLAYLESIEKTPNVDAKVLEIIDEEMQYFFADAKTAQETANLIQSRVSIYLSESK